MNSLDNYGRPQWARADAIPHHPVKSTERLNVATRTVRRWIDLGRALPLGWESMDYTEFLRERRRRMADIIRVAFRQLGGE